MVCAPGYVWLWPGDGQVSPADRGLAYGDGLFETILMTPSGPVLLDAHLRRLRRGAHFLDIPCSDRALGFWWSEVERRWQQGPRRFGVIKVIWTRGVGSRGYRPSSPATPTVITSFHENPPMPPVAGVVVARSNLRVAQVTGHGYKTLNRLDQVRASSTLPSGCFDAILGDSWGRPLEGTRSNLFLFTDTELLTPPAQHLAVVGVMRNFLLERLPANAIRVREAAFSWQDVAHSRGMMLVNSVFGLAPVRQVGCLELSLDSRIARIRQLLEQELGFKFIA